MMDWFKKLFVRSGEVEETANEMVKLFMRHVTVAQIRNARLVADAERIVLGQATGAKRRFEWSATSVARFSNRFGWKLHDRGYPKEESLAIAKKLAVNLAGKAKNKNA